MKIINLKAKPIEVHAIKWENNEAEIREFVKDDTLLKFKDEGLLIWNKEEQTWLSVPALHFIVKGIKDELTSESPEMLEKEIHDRSGVK